MANEPGDGDGDRTGGPTALPQHPLVERLKPDPSQPAKRVVVLTGLPGDSDRPGYQRLYLTTKLDYYAEFMTADMVAAEAVPAERSPLSGTEATQVSVARDATIHYIWARSAQPVDEFDLDIRLGTPVAVPFHLGTKIGGGPGGTCETCLTQCSDTKCGGTCQTCETCQTCAGQATCQTCPGQATCQTCAGQATCQTCQTNCNQHTCGGTCITCARTCETCCLPNTCM